MIGQEQINQSLVNQIFDYYFKDQNIFFKSYVFFMHSDNFILIYAYNKNDEIKVNYKKFKLFKHCKKTNNTVYKIKLNDFLQHKQTLNF